MLWTSEVHPPLSSDACAPRRAADSSLQMLTRDALEEQRKLSERLQKMRNDADRHDAASAHLGQARRKWASAAAEAAGVDKAAQVRTPRLESWLELT